MPLDGKSGIPIVSPGSVSAAPVGPPPLGIAPPKPKVLEAVNVSSDASPAHIRLMLPVKTETGKQSPIATSHEPSEEMPGLLLAQLTDFEEWAVANQKQARSDAIKFWVLKIPAIIASASAGIFAYYKWEVVPLFAGAIASICVLIDGLNPGGALRNAHYKAFFELRQLETAMQTKWRVGVHKTTGIFQRAELAATIIEDAQKRWEQISEDLKKAETLAAK